jgi:hypothetical protein
MEAVKASFSESDHTTENVRSGNEGLSGGYQDQMRDEEEDKTFFTNQTGTRYSPKPL